MGLWGMLITKQKIIYNIGSETYTTRKGADRWVAYNKIAHLCCNFNIRNYMVFKPSPNTIKIIINLKVKESFQLLAIR
jgi:hypothetical protein